MTLRQIHPGGYFWSLPRVDRDATLLRIASVLRKMLVLAPDESSAERLAERLTLSGVPVLLAIEGGRCDALEMYRSDGVSALVTTSSFLHQHGPVSAPIVIHNRLADSVREYSRRVELALSKAHVSFVVSEDEVLASALAAQLAMPPVIDLDPIATFDSILDLVEGTDDAIVPARRRFPLSR